MEKRNIIVGEGRKSLHGAVALLQETFDPAVSPMPLAYTTKEDLAQVIHNLAETAVYIDGNFPDVDTENGEITRIEYVSRSGRSEFVWTAADGQYTFRGTRFSNLVFWKLEGQDCTEVLTGESGHCYIHQPNTADNPKNRWVFVPEGGDWRREYAGRTDLLRAEGHDFIRLD